MEGSVMDKSKEMIGKAGVKEKTERGVFGTFSLFK